MKSRMQDKARKKLGQDYSRWTIDNNVAKTHQNKLRKSTVTVLQIIAHNNWTYNLMP